MKLHTIILISLASLFSNVNASAATGTIAMSGTIVNNCTLTLGTAPDDASVATMLKARGASTVGFSFAATCDAPGMAIHVASTNGGFKGALASNSVPQQYNISIAGTGLTTTSVVSSTSDQRVTAMTASTVTATVSVKDYPSFPTMPDKYSDMLTFSLVAE